MPNFKHSQVDMQWKSCPSLEGHEISEHGHLRRIMELENHSSRYPSGRQYCYGLAGKGYPFYNVKFGDKRKNFYAHKLVAEAFIGKQPENTEVAHNNGDKLNCHYTNLRYATPKENNADKIKHGTYISGDTHPKTKLKIENLQTVLVMRKNGLTQKQIGDELLVSQACVGRFLLRLSNTNLVALTS